MPSRQVGPSTYWFLDLDRYLLKRAMADSGTSNREIEGLAPAFAAIAVTDERRATSEGGGVSSPLVLGRGP